MTVHLHTHVHFSLRRAARDASLPDLERRLERVKASLTSLARAVEAAHPELRGKRQNELMAADNPESRVMRAAVDEWERLEGAIREERSRRQSARSRF